jgi:hypothetical protein
MVFIMIALATAFFAVVDLSLNGLMKVILGLGR